MVMDGESRFVMVSSIFLFNWLLFDAKYPNHTLLDITSRLILEVKFVK
jgi:hypothetical protein